ncbi:unnamed protein product, partial [Ectocarpus sp. 12 AP-2014]
MCRSSSPFISIRPSADISCTEDARHPNGPIGPFHRSKGSFVGSIRRVVHHRPPGAHHPTIAVADEHVSRFNDWAHQSNSPPVRRQGVSTSKRPFFPTKFFVAPGRTWGAFRGTNGAA